MSFTPPEIKPIAKQEAFRFWCQKVLPEIYDDSLSYSELLGKVMIKLNEALETINSYSDTIERIDEDHQELVIRIRNLAEEIAKELHNLGVEIDKKQEKLIAGAGITIEGNVISSTAVGNVISVNGKTGRVVLNANDVNALPVGYHDDTKQDTITDLAAIRRGAELGDTALQSVPDTYRTSAEQDEIDDALSDRINNIELSKFPNAVIVGEPLIVGSNVSRFSRNDYMVFPFVVDVRGYPFVIDFCFNTADDVTTQQNILDSHFGLALAVQGGKGIMAMSSNGNSWDIGTSSGSVNIAPNSVYYAKLAWDGSVYTTAISTDGESYTEDMRIESTTGLFPTAVYIGGSPDLFGAGSAHPFTGGVDMSKAKLTVGGLEVWDGMSDPGLASRANVSLSNLDALGLEKFKAENIPYTSGETESNVGAEISKAKEDLTRKVGYSEVVGKQLLMYSDSTKTNLLATLDLPTADLTDYVKYTDYASSSKAGVIKSGNLYGVGVNASGEMYAASYTAATYPSKSGGMFIGKTMLNTVLANPSIQPALTEAEQLAGRQRLGLPGNFELIETISIPDDIYYIVREADVDGTPYNFKSALVEINTGAGAGSSSINVTVSIGDTVYNNGVTNAIMTTPRSSYFSAFDINGIKQFTSRNSSGGGIYAVNSVSQGIAINNGNIGKIRVETASATIKIPGGTIIKIYAVRA